MTFAELKTELYARGTDYLSEDAQGVIRAERWLNQGYREILNLQAWTFLRTTATGTEGAGFVAVPDLRRVRFVVNVDGGHEWVLQRTSMEDLTQSESDLTLTGTPELYYIEGGQIKAYPVGGTIKAYYLKRVPPMTGTDEPIFDEEYHPLIVDRAMMKAYADSDNFEALAALKLEFDAGVSAMAEDYTLETREVSYLEPTGMDL